MHHDSMVDGVHWEVNYTWLFSKQLQDPNCSLYDDVSTHRREELDAKLSKLLNDSPGRRITQLAHLSFSHIRP